MKTDQSIYSNFVIKLERDPNQILTKFAFSHVSKEIIKIPGFSKDKILNGHQFAQALNMDYDFWLSFINYTYINETSQKQYVHIKEAHLYIEIHLVKIDEDLLTGYFKTIDKVTYQILYNKHQQNLLESLQPSLSRPNLCVFIVQYIDHQYKVIDHNFKTQQIIKNTSKGYWNLFNESTQKKILDICDVVLKTTNAKVSNLHYDHNTLKCEFIPFFDTFGGRYILITETDNTTTETLNEKIHLFEDYIQGLFFRLNAIILITDKETYELLDANPYALEFYGYTREEFLSMSVQDYNINPLIYSLDTVLTEIPHRLHDGTIRYLDIHPNIISIAGREVRITISYDVTDRVDLSKRLERESTLLKTTLNAITEGVITLDRNNKIIGLNQASKNILGTDFNQDTLMIRDAQTLETLSLNEILNSGVLETTLTSHYEIKSSETQWTPITYTISPINEEENQGNVMVFRNIEKDLEYIKQMRYLSYHDSLTGLYNRRYLQKEFESNIKDADYPLALVFADANDLKRVNDLYGHHIGDKFLINIANILKSNFNTNALVSRWGGDEFLILIKNANEAAVNSLIKKIKTETNINLNSSYPMDYKPNFAMGYAMIDAFDQNLPKHIALAERYMYREKRIEAARFRNRVVDGYLMQLHETRAETKRHSQRLEALCFAMGSRLSLTSSQMESLSSLALLHDIGKTKIDVNIIDKPTVLSDDEWEIMRKHPRYGYEIAVQYLELSTVAYLILTHHERYDGKGYPLNLKGDNIPIESRILSIVDAFDAMTHDRPYHKAISIEEALTEISNHAGTQFDPILAKIFTELPLSLLKNI